jgi:release factor glutamine methyltransferase
MPPPPPAEDGLAVPGDEGDQGDPGETIAWRVLLAEAAVRLGRARPGLVADPAVEARWLVEQATGLDGAELVLGLDEPATRRGVHALDAMVARRLDGEPLQYVVGRWGFRTLDLLVDRRVLIPRPETEVVVEAALAELDRVRAALVSGERPRAVDLGTGSGAIALSLAAERPGTQVWATDASPEALAVAAANLAGLGRAGTAVRLAQGSWFDALPAELRGGLHLVVSNPPYVAEADPLPAEVAEWEPRGALVPGPAGTEALDVLVDQAPGWLAPGGALVVELAPWQAAAVADRARAAGFAQAEVGADLAGRDRFVVARLAGPTP